MLREEYPRSDFVWALQTLCVLHRRPFDADLLLQQFPPPYDGAALIHAARGLGFKSQLRAAEEEVLDQLPLPLLLELRASNVPQAVDSVEPATERAESAVTASEVPSLNGLGLLIAISADQVVWLQANAKTPITVPRADLLSELTGRAFLLYPENEAIRGKRLAVAS